MASKQINFRLSDEARASSDRLQGQWGYASRTDAVEASLECWETALSLAAEDVSRRFTPAEWNMVAAVCNGTMWPYGHTGNRPGMLLAASVEDGHRLDGEGYQWLISHDGPTITIPSAERVRADEAAADLVRRLAVLDYCQAWAVIRAVCWFWQHPDVGVGHQWWTPEFRRQWPTVGGEGE